MPTTNPWLAGPAPTQELPREQLEERILNLLSSQNMAVVATVNRDGSPAATPVRYSSLGFEIFYSSWNTSVKSRNLRRDPRVSVGRGGWLAARRGSGRIERRAASATAAGEDRRELRQLDDGAALCASPGRTRLPGRTHTVPSPRGASRGGDRHRWTLDRGRLGESPAQRARRRRDEWLRHSALTPGRRRSLAAISRSLAGLARA